MRGALSPKGEHILQSPFNLIFSIVFRANGAMKDYTIIKYNGFSLQMTYGRKLLCRTILLGPNPTPKKGPSPIGLTD